MAKSSSTVPFRQEIAEGYYGFRVPGLPAGQISTQVENMVQRSLTLFRTLDKGQKKLAQETEEKA